MITLYKSEAVVIDGTTFCLDEIGRVWREGDDEWHVSTKSIGMVRRHMRAQRRALEACAIDYKQRKEISRKKTDESALKSKQTLKFWLIDSK